MNTQRRRSALHGACPGCRGLTLVEILVALLILSIGLLGLAGLQTLSLRFNTSAYFRTQATTLAYSLADRMRANRQAALDGLYTFDFEASPLPCGVPDGSGTVPDQEIAAWRNALACRLPQSNGAVTQNGNVFTLTVRLDDSQGREDPLEFQFTTAL
ncbi:MAG: type IV pilus modification protein PilV [Woeseiaceae bacterium]